MAGFTFAPLTPVAFLERSARAFTVRTAVVDGDLRITYGELADRCARLVSVLADLGLGPGDRVATLCTNSHVLLELHHAVPARGAVLVSVNIRLSADEMRYILEHSGARMLVATHELIERARVLAAACGLRLVVAGGPEDEYDALLAGTTAGPGDRIAVPEQELLAINYTSGTTGRPKGVMYHHRGAYLQAVAMAYHAHLGPGASYLWTLPMFHCNGWCFTWAVTAAGGTHVCLRSLRPDRVWRLLREEGITHLSAAPTVLTMIAEDPAAESLPERVHVDTGGAPPSPALLARLARLGLDVTHLYGLTETFGPVAICEWQPEWDDLDDETTARLRARQGIGNIIASPLRILDPEGRDVPADGVTIGEIAARGNDVMLGYYRDPDATAAVTRSGCFLTGDLGVMHPDGYVEIRDRRKDIIISGGENIASIEVEQALDSHPDIVESAVVGAPDEKWGEVPVAYVTVRSGATVSADELVTHVRTRLAGFKAPRRVVFADLPKTSTGKVQKNVLREMGDRLMPAIDVHRRVEPGTVANLHRLPRWDLTSIETIRSTYTAVGPPPTPPHPGVRRTDEVLPGLAGRPDVRVRWYRPVDAAEPRPCVVWLHGGGYIMGTLDENDDRLDRMVLETGCTVASVGWRLAPEHPYPAGMDDVEAVWRRVSEDPGAFGVDPARLMLGGASAGAGLAAGACIRLREEGLPQPALQLLIYPMLDDREVTPSIRAIEDDPGHWGFWHLRANRLCWEAYLGPLAGGDVPPSAVPARAEDLSGLAPAFVAVGDVDAFVDEDIAYAARLLQAGVPTELHVYPGVIHGGFGTPPATPRTAQLQRDVYGALRAVVASEFPLQSGGL